MEQSTAGQFNSYDLKKRAINVFKYVVTPSLIYIISQRGGNMPIDRMVVKAGIVWAVIDFLHRLTRDNSTPNQ